MPLRPYNPVTSVPREDLEVSPYERSRKIAKEDFQKILRQIDPSTVVGARDRAMFLFYVLCARRRAEVVNLRGGDIRQNGGGRMVYHVRLKGGKRTHKELPTAGVGGDPALFDPGGAALADG